MLLSRSSARTQEDPVAAVLAPGARPQQRLAGLTPGRLPRYVKRYADLGGILEAAQAFAVEVRTGTFPTDEHSYH